MRKLLFSLMVLGMAAAAPAQTYTTAFTSDPADLQDLFVADVAAANLVANVDTDLDGRPEVVYTRANASSDTLQLRIYEAIDANNGYALVYSDDITTITGNIVLSSYGDVLVADADNANGPEIYVFCSGPTNPVSSNVFVYANTGNNAWGTGATVASNEFTASRLIDAFAPATADTELMGASIGDLDADGQLEFFIADDENNAVGVWNLTGNWIGGTAAFTLEDEVNDIAGTAFGGSPFTADMFDLNADGALEGVIGFWNSAGFGIINKTAPNVYAGVRDLSPGISGTGVLDEAFRPNGVLAHDFNGDGVVTVFGMAAGPGDIYSFSGVASGDSLTSIGVITKFLNGPTDLGTARSGTNTNTPTQSGFEMDVTDLDNDGNDELVFLYQDRPTTAPGGELIIAEYNGTGAENVLSNFTITRGTATGLTLPEIGISVRAGDPGALIDMDNDSLPEIVVGTPGAGATASGLYIFEAPAPGTAIDGYVGSAEYGAGFQLAVQTVQTQFGDKVTTGGPDQNGSGSELDSLSIRDTTTDLIIGLAGNFEINGNQACILIDADNNGATGVNTIPANPFNFHVGTVLPTGFGADIAITPNAGGPGQSVYTNVHTFDSTVSSDFVGSAAGTAGAATVGTITGNVEGISRSFQVALDNRNYRGVEGGAAAATGNAAAVRNGLEISIPRALFTSVGAPTGQTTIKVMVFIANGSGNFISNQFLPPLTVAAGNVGAAPNLASALVPATYTYANALSTSVADWTLYEN